jgi:hypothetical protein
MEDGCRATSDKYRVINGIIGKFIGTFSVKEIKVKKHRSEPLNV